MKTISKLFGVVAAIAALAACNKEVDFKPVVPEGMQRVTIKVNTLGTKVAIDDESDGSFVWSDGETLAVKCEGYSEEYTIELTGDNTFTGDIPAGATITDVIYTGDDKGEFPSQYTTAFYQYLQYGLNGQAQEEYLFDTDKKFPFPLHWDQTYGGDIETGITLFPDSYVFVRGSLAGVKAYSDYDNPPYVELTVKAIDKVTEDPYAVSFKLYLCEDTAYYFLDYAVEDEESGLLTYRFTEDDGKYFTFYLPMSACQTLAAPAFYVNEDGTNVLLGHTKVAGDAPINLAAIWGLGEGVSSNTSNRYKVYKYAYNINAQYYIVDQPFVVTDTYLSAGSVTYGFKWGDITNLPEEIETKNGADIKAQYDVDTDYLDDAKEYLCVIEEGGIYVLNYSDHEFISLDAAFEDSRTVTYRHFSQRQAEGLAILEETTDLVYSNFIKGNPWTVILDSNGLYVLSNEVPCEVSNAEVYGCSVVDDRVVLSSESYNKIPANTAVILKGEPGVEVEITNLEEEVGFIDSALTPCVLMTMVTPETVYVLSTDDEGKPVFKLFSGSEIPVRNGYLVKD